MEIKFNNVCLNKIVNDFNLNISSDIYSFIGMTISDIKNILNGNFTSGEVCIGKKKIKPKEKIKNNINEDIAYLDSNLFNINIYEDLRYGNKNIDKIKILEYFNTFDLDDSILKKNYTEISRGEVSKILLIKMLIEDKKIYIMENPSLYLDNKSENTLIKYLKALKHKDKLIIILTNNIEFAFKSSSNIVIINNKIKICDNKYNIFDSFNKIPKPEIIDFIYYVKDEKNVKLCNRDNINDLVKDIYRNAK